MPPELAENKTMTHRISKPEPNEAKFKELVLLVAKQSEGDGTFGATKLNKLLFYIDFLSYLNLGKAVTGMQYQKLDRGPAPKKLVPITKQMTENGDIIQ